MISGQELLIAVAIAVSVWAGGEVVKGTKAVAHGVKHAVVKIVHPHRHHDDPTTGN